MSIREQKGKEIANRINITQDGNLWLVPSQSGKGKYKVNPEKQSCSCPDYDFRRQKCKHIFAVEETIERTKTVVVEADKMTVTETVKVTRKTYAQVWPAYNAAQTQEKRTCFVNFVKALESLHRLTADPACLSKILCFRWPSRFTLQCPVAASSPI